MDVELCKQLKWHLNSDNFDIVILPWYHDFRYFAHIILRYYFFPTSIPFYIINLIIFTEWEIQYMQQLFSMCWIIYLKEYFCFFRQFKRGREGGNKREGRKGGRKGERKEEERKSINLFASLNICRKNRLVTNLCIFYSFEG